ncbi:EAL domain-containing protein [Solibacillus sp. FSL K6-1523]|uniref:EAL domain-containing protein n=1 Tax=Solibacillus sp. FSL K6-1523 TaxID=2921471 RepID=UPI0030F6C748
MYKYYNQNFDKDDMYFWLCQMARQFESGVVVINPAKGNVIDFVNQVFIRMTDYSESELIGKKLNILHGPLTDVLNEDAIQECIENGLSFTTSSYHYRKDGSTFWNEISILPLKDLDGELQYCLLMMKDVTDAMKVDALLELERNIYYKLENGDPLEYVLGEICNHVEITFRNQCHCTIILIDENRKVTEVYGGSTKTFEMTKYQAFFMGNDSHDFSLSLDRKATFIKNIKSTIYYEQYKHLIDKENIVSLWGQPIFNKEEEVIGFFSIYFEQEMEPQATDYKFIITNVAPIVSLAVKYYNQKNAIHSLAFYDSATGLSNFEGFKSKMTADWEAGMENSYLYIIEPSEYQNIVDLYGRQGGDKILVKIAKRLQNIFAEHKLFIARYTNSAIIIASKLKNSDLQFTQAEIDHLLFEPYCINNKDVFITLKVGTSKVCLETPIDQAIRQADTALSIALKSVGTVIKKFEVEQVESVANEMNVLANIAKGLRKDEFMPMLQPKVDIKTGEINSFEALARWISPELGFVSPALFIPVAENTGNISEIDRAIFKKVLQWQKDRQENNLPMYQVSINISPNHFYHPAFVENVKELIEKYGVEPKYIKFEITESIELDNVMRAKKIINDLMRYGIATSIDDFGVGYSSLSYLQELPFEEIKIDKSFVDNLADPRMHAVIKTIIHLSRNLNMRCVAEGIETEEQHKELLQLGCNSGQGYYYFKPMPLHEVDELLQKKAQIQTQT